MPMRVSIGISHQFGMPGIWTWACISSLTSSSKEVRLKGTLPSSAATLLGASMPCDAR